MADKIAVDINTQKLAKCLIEGNKKNALTLIRTKLSEENEDAPQLMVWKGWERALNRQENNSLIYQLLNAMPLKDAKKVYSDLKRKKTEILIRDYTQIELSTNYLPLWISLLENYCNIHKDNQ
ncbi:MAG: hypothetical protein JXA54_07040 [Candidatus Heimdallarchaeota archaeon]|nr:hypothetical protein [Candidatus Heimdallarchaeota archaeon]